MHANSASAALTRLEQLIGERTTQIPCQLIADAIDLVVFMKRTPTGRRVEEIARVEGLAEGAYRLIKPSPLELVVSNEGATP